MKIRNISNINEIYKKALHLITELSLASKTLKYLIKTLRGSGSTSSKRRGLFISAYNDLFRNISITSCRNTNAATPEHIAYIAAIRSKLLISSDLQFSFRSIIFRWLFLDVKPQSQRPEALQTKSKSRNWTKTTEYSPAVSLFL